MADRLSESLMGFLGITGEINEAHEALGNAAADIVHLRQQLNARPDITVADYQQLILGLAAVQAARDQEAAAALAERERAEVVRATAEVERVRLATELHRLQLATTAAIQTAAQLVTDQQTATDAIAALHLPAALEQARLDAIDAAIADHDDQGRNAQAERLYRAELNNLRPLTVAAIQAAAPVVPPVVVVVPARIQQNRELAQVLKTGAPTQLHINRAADILLDRNADPVAKQEIQAAVQAAPQEVKSALSQVRYARPIKKK